jgi:MFS family permease
MKIRINITVNKAIQVMLFYLFFVVLSTALFAPIFAVFITESIEGATLKIVGFAIALYGIAKSILQIPLSRYLDSHKGEKDDFRALIVGASIAVVYPFCLIFISQPWHLYMLEILIGLGDAFLMAAYYSLFARHIDKGSEGFEWSLFSVGGLTISSSIGIAVGGVMADLFGFRFLFGLSAIINFAVLFALLYLYPLLDGGRKVALPPFSPIPKNPATKH